VRRVRAPGAAADRRKDRQFIAVMNWPIGFCILLVDGKQVLFTEMCERRVLRQDRRADCGCVRGAWQRKGYLFGADGVAGAAEEKNSNCDRFIRLAGYHLRLTTRCRVWCSFKIDLLAAVTVAFGD
jgi:hypothetical protein